MKHLTVVLLALAAVAPAWAQVADDSVERARIGAERKAADDKFAEAKRACNAKFAVTDCVNKATREHNAVVSELRRQERVLNEAERKQRAAQAQREIDERNSPERRKEAEDKRLRALEEQKEREARAAEKKAQRAEDDAERAKKGPRAPRIAEGHQGPQGSPRAPEPPKGPSVTPEEAAKNRAAYEERLRQAAQHKAEVQARIAKRAKPPASALPVPN
ncbi:MAG TPA: hypothetical protein VHL79_21750 [Ramlibacter sp.]|jgi:hypothetical protein|nr:hypothetical protein [Ramlibacter sp.]